MGVGADAGGTLVRAGGGAMIIEIESSSLVPPYEQLRLQLATMIESGVLPAGHRLPSVRQLAGDLGLANGTVARAYRELESADLVRTAGRNGTVVTPTATITVAARQSRCLREAADAFVRLTRQLGAADQEKMVAVAKAGLRPAPASER